MAVRALPFVPGSARLGLFAIAAMAAAGPAPVAQTVLPPSHATMAGTGSTNVPFGRSTPVRAQFAYDPSLFDPVPVTVGRLDFRTEEDLVLPTKRAEVTLSMSSMGQGVTLLQSTFALNRGPDETVVFDRKIVDLPAITTARSPAGFFPRFPLDRPFTYDPTRPASGCLLVEVVVHGQQPLGYTLDTAYLCDSPRIDYGPPGCGPVGGPVLGVESVTTQVTWGRPLVLRVFDAAPSAPTFLLSGLIESGTWMGLPIPLDLTPYGASGCSLSIDAWATAPGVADVGGSATYSLFVPSIPSLQSTWLRFQGASIAPGANALGVVTSRPTKVQVCGWEAVGRVFAAGLAAPDGQRELGTAPVLRLLP